MIKAVAIDDEPLALKVIEQFCVQTQNIQLLRSFTSSTEALQFLEHNNDVELLFLDINMPSIGGMELYQKLISKPPVIFTTAHSEFAVEGFNLNAVDYLLKPFTYKRFEQSIKKVTSLKLLLNNSPVEQDFIVLKADYSRIKVALADIEMLESLDNYVKIHFAQDKPLMVRITLKNFIELLPKNRFVRIHRSYIVPVHNVKIVRNKTLYFKHFELPIGANFEKEVLALIGR